MKYFQKNGLDKQCNIANTIKSQITTFQPQVPIIVLLRNPGMRDRHWQKISTEMNINLLPIEQFTTDQILNFDLSQNMDLVSRVSEAAAKEYQIEQALDKMNGEWDSIILQIANYKDSGTGILKGVDDISAILDEQITMTQTILFSAFKGKISWLFPYRIRYCLM